jgi:L-rhamnose mutarotase
MGELSLRDTDRYVLTIDLRDDPAGLEAYRAHHAAVWPEVVQSLQDAGIHELALHLLGRRLVMIVEVERGVDLRSAFERHASSHPRVMEWERLMATFQQPAPAAGAGEWWALMEPICRIAGEPPGGGGAGTLPGRSS